MIEENDPGADRAGDGSSSRLLLLAFMMIAAGLGLWRLDDRSDGRNAPEQQLILAGQSR